MKERRYTPGHIEVRADGDAAMTIVGHASVFNTPYEMPGFREQVAPGAFKKSLKEGDVAALYNHDSNIVLGRKRSGTLRLEEDEQGLRYEVDLPDTQAARDLYTLIERGDIYQSSFAFEIQREKWDKAEEDGGLPLRTIKQVRLWDISPVTFPASPDTDVDVARAMRCLSEAFADEQEIREATTEAQDVAQPETAPESTPPQEPQRTSHYSDLPPL